MKVLRDYCCWECKIYVEDTREYGDYPKCPQCCQEMAVYYSNMNFNSYFSGSHNAEYGTHGRKFNGCTKEQLLKNVTKKKRILEGRHKAGHCDPRELKDD